MGYSKLSIITEMLLLTGQNTCTEDDGSAEWNVCSAAYDQGAKYLLQDHDWKFGTAIVALDRLGASPDGEFEDQYQKPIGSLHIVWVKLTADSDDIDGEFEDTTYRIVGNKILLTDGDSDVMCKYVMEPDPESWPPMFVSALQGFVKAGIFGGLKKDPENARAEQKIALALADRAKSRTDQEESKRALFQTHRRLARQTRRV